VIAPWREWKLRGRADCIAYAQDRGFSVPVTPEKPYSMDANLMHVSYEGGILEDPWEPPPAGMFRMTVDPEQAPDEPQWVTVTFERGTPVAIDGDELAQSNSSPRPTPSPAHTASAGSTSSRIGSSA
jgi:argininosuccinate synthase